MAPSSSLHLTSLRPLALGLLGGAALALSPSCGPTKTCGPASCTGCCDSVGQCQAGLTANACGISGNLCSTCLIGQTCSAGTCTGGVGGGTGGAGGGFGGGGGSAGGGAAGGWGGGSGGGSGAVDAFINQVAPAYCAKLVSCGDVASGASGDCETLIRNLGYANMAKAVARGSLRMDSTAAAACLSGLASATCDTLSSVYGRTCGVVFVANASTGGTCTATSECVDPAQGCSGATYCTQTCGPTGAIGQPCTGGGRCNAGAYCASGTCRAQLSAGNACPQSTMCDGNSTCSSGVCVALPQANQACRTNYPQCVATAYCASGTCRLRKTQGAVCSYSSECASGLGCISGTCTPLLGVGVPCRAYDQCQADLSCDEVLRTCQRYTFTVPGGGRCTDTQRCQDYEHKCRGLLTNPDGGVGTQGVCGLTQPGDPCTWASDCGNGTYCNGSPQGVCAAASLGSVCSYDRNCLPAHFCNPSTTPSTCTPQVASGQPCTSFDRCAQPNEVCFAFDSAPNDLRCRAKGAALNAECSSSSSGTCLFPYECQAGRCGHAGSQGEPCITYVGCFNGACLADGGAAYGPPGVCQPKQPLGAPCRVSWDCASGECDQAGLCIAACP